MDSEQDAIRIYLRVFGPVLLIAGLLPFDFYGRDPVWPWEGLMDGSWSDGLAILLPIAGGALFMILGRLRAHRMVLAGAVALALLLAWMVQGWSGMTVHSIGAYDHLTDGLPRLFARAFWLLIVGIILLAGGIRLGAAGYLTPDPGRPRLTDPWPVARVLTGAGILIVILFYFLPYRGALPLTVLLTGVVELGTNLSTPAGIALLAGHLLSLGPLLFALFSIARLMRRAPGHGGVLVTFMLAFLPALSLLVGLRNLAVMAAYTLPHLRAAALIMTIVVGATLALTILVRGAWYEVPWSIGRLTRADRVLASALAEKDSSAALAQSLAALHPMVRPFVRRRLVLWRSAALEVPGAGEADLGRVMRFLEGRWSEEQAVGQELAAGWPAWWIGHRITWVATAVAISLTTLTILAAHRPATKLDWPTTMDSQALDRIFRDDIAAVVSDMSRRSPVLEPGSLAALGDSLDAAEPACPGIREAVTDLLELGRQGRQRLHSIWRARDSLNRLLQEYGVPYFVRSRVRAGRGVGGADLFYVMSYRVTDSRHYRCRDDDREFAVLHLRRADRLNLVERYIGSTDQAETYVSILVGRLSKFVEHNLLPVLERDDLLGEAARRGLRAAGIMSQAEHASLEAFVNEGLTRHELHHRWMGLDPEPAAQLWAWMSAYSDEAVHGVASELGAFLGELATGPGYARLRLALMLDAMESQSAQVGHHGLARRFLLDRLLGPASKAWARLAAMRDEDIAGRVQGLHRELFGVDVPRFDPVDNHVP